MTRTFALVSTSVVQNEQIEVDVEQLMDLMKTRKQQLESLLSEEMKDYSLICDLEYVRLYIAYQKKSCMTSFFLFSK